MQYLNVREASSILGISEQAVRRLCKSGELNAELIKNKWAIINSSVETYAKSKEKTKDSAPSATQENTTPTPKKGLKLLSFFSGAMGLDIGLEKAGFETLLASEIDKSARKTISSNKPDIALLSDIRNYSKEDVLEAAGLSEEDDVDLIAGGPPCQAFSTAGRRLGLEDERGNVFLKYLDLAFEIRPKFLVIENVRGLLSAPLKHRPHDKRGDLFPPLSSEEHPGGVLHYILRMVEAAGYSYSFNLYNAANFGVPQCRERVIIICSRDGERIPFLEPTHSQNGEHGLKKWVTFREATSGISGNHDHLNFPEKRIKYYKLLGPGEYWKNLPVELQKEALGNAYYSGGGKTGFLRRVHWDKPSPTLVTHPAMPATDLAHPNENRPLSIQEYKRLQQFPDSWIIEGKLLNQYKQLGNAVPVGLGLAIGKAIVNHLSGISNREIPGFKYSRYKNTSDIEFRENKKEELQQALL